MANPPVTVLNFKKFIAEEKLMGTKCAKCNNVDLPARPLCSKCTSPDVDWFQMKGTGKLVAFSTIHVGTTFFKERGFDAKKPYAFCVVQTDEGPCVSAQLIGVDTNKPTETIKIGMPVKSKFIKSMEKEMERIDLGFEPA